jgi:hypothetical protein
MFRHDPANGVYGDCHRTALACIFDKDSPLDVPHFLEDDPPSETFYKREAAWLLEQGFRSYHFPLEAALSSAMEYMETFAPGVHYIFGGRSARGTNHSVIGCGGKLVHDPHPANDFIAGPCDDGYFWIELFIPVRFWSGQ